MLWRFCIGSLFAHGLLLGTLFFLLRSHFTPRSKIQHPSAVLWVDPQAVAPKTQAIAPPSRARSKRGAAPGAQKKSGGEAETFVLSHEANSWREGKFAAPTRHAGDAHPWVLRPGLEDEADPVEAGTLRPYQPSRGMIKGRDWSPGSKSLPFGAGVDLFQLADWIWNHRRNEWYEEERKRLKEDAERAERKAGSVDK